MNLCRKCGEPSMNELYELCYRHWRDVVGEPDTRKRVPRHKKKRGRAPQKESNASL